MLILLKWLLHESGDIFGDFRIILQHAPIMTGEQQIRRRYPCTQLLVSFHPPDQINDEDTGPILTVVAKDMGAVGADNGRSSNGIHCNGLQCDGVSRGQEALDAG